MVMTFTPKKARSHQRILDAASRSVRRSGFHGVGVADVMKEAGMTVGGFYSHFESKEALLAEAVLHASRNIDNLIRGNVERLAKDGQSRFRAFVETYLSDSQIANCENGCPVAALCSQMQGQVGELKDSSEKIVGNLQKLVQEALPTGSEQGAVWSVTSTIVGALQLARVLGDNKEGRAILADARTHLIDLYAEQRQTMGVH